MDVVNGKYSPKLVLSCVQRLPEDSLTLALVGGGRHLFGWSLMNNQLADIFDGLSLNTRATGMWDKKPPELPQAYRPGESERVKPKKRQPSLAQIHAKFARGGS